ncbi:HAMP domain-containing histidine kinase [Vallitalea pronyensis]|uniref:histidine kinase n=1 Tax=Vallitalea pronyensis TaxID=1348613 RepID=A0A8J8MFU1_9FIRM|nr:HAMP domain-containing sensor histidine kinase [Vallitalea pronyensis]QUI20805.1 HAMP domain-containing histidine kinase [Vallitalea pronyensis]
MTYKIRTVFFICMGIIIALALFFMMTVNKQFSHKRVEEQAGYVQVMINEIKHITKDIEMSEHNQEAIEQLNQIVDHHVMEALTESTDIEKMGNTANRYILAAMCIVLIFLMLIFIYLHQRLLKPFANLEDFAKRIAEGRFDRSLEMQRKNIFGAFTKAFDMMRNELKMSREREEASIDAKKTLIATLSHDIKTPVASIRAYAEGLTGGVHITEERKEKYLHVIIKKADEITTLTDDLFLHAISDMDKLAFDIQTYHGKEILEEILLPLYIQYDGRLKVMGALPEVDIVTDKMRLAQIFNNILANSAKYAKDSDLYISFLEKESYLECIFRDEGEGVLPEDMPFLFDKFYRGKQIDALNIPGTGLGLYIVNYIMEKTDGYVRCRNQDGFEVTIGIKCLRKI